MNAERTKNTTTGCTHQLSTRRVCPKPEGDNGTSTRAIKPPHCLDRSDHQPESTCRCITTESEAENIIQVKSLLRFWRRADIRAGDTAGVVLHKICNIESWPALWYSLRDCRFASWR